MQFIFYAILVIALFYIGKIEKKFNVAVISAPLAIPLGIFMAIGAVVALIVLFKVFLLVIALLLFLLLKLKAIIGAKIAMFLGTMLASVLSVFLGPLSPLIISVLWIILFLSLGAAIKDAFFDLYSGIFTMFGKFLLGVRTIADRIRVGLPTFLRFLVFIIEMPLVCALSIYGVWKAMNWIDDNPEITINILIFRLLILVPFSIFLYRSYIKSTTPPQQGDDGIDLPLPIEISDIASTISH